jgi:hypothetical protein
VSFTVRSFPEQFPDYHNLGTKLGAFYVLPSFLDTFSSMYDCLRCRFYVNEREQPPRPSWEHPMNLSQYTPPPGPPPPPNRDYNSSPYGGGYKQGGGYAPSKGRGDY